MTVRTVGSTSALRPRALATLTLVVVICTACGDSGSGGAEPPASVTASLTSGSAGGPTAPTTSPPCAERVFASMTEPQRIGQIFILGLAGDRLGPAEQAAIGEDHFGSVTFVVTTSEGGSAIRSVTEAVQGLATRQATAGVRFFVAANQEGGLIQALRGSGFSTMPSAQEQGLLSPSTLQAEAERWGRELVAAGVNLNFAPVMDVLPPGADATNQPIGALHRGFGHDPSTVGAHGVAFLRGMDRAGVQTSAKHFPGLGRVRGNTDFTAGVVDATTTANDPYLRSFRQAVAAGVPFVMVALATYSRIDPSHLAVFSPSIVTGLLRGDLHFKGVIVSDDLGASTAVAAVPAGQRATDFLSAGGDMVISKTVRPAEAMYRTVLTRTRSDPAFRARVDDATLRVLRAKQAAKLLPCGSG